MSHSELTRATQSALSFLREQADLGFPDAAHQMSFPRRAGFVLGRRETHRSDLFARATIANVLLDAAELYRALNRRAEAELCLVVARREADYLASARLTDRAGGWSYFPTLPELPPDLDSLAAVTSLFARVDARLAQTVRRPIELALSGLHPRGGFETWLISEQDPPRKRRAMRDAVVRFWGTGPDPEVNAAFCRALLRLDPLRYARAIERGVRFMRETQAENGSWPASWYWGAGWGSLAALELLAAAPQGAQSDLGALSRRCAAHFVCTQAEDGGWGPFETVPLETALALHVLAICDEPPQGAIRRGLACLLELRTRGGYFKHSPWLRMDVGRAEGRTLQTLTFTSHSVSTAVCLRTLLLLESRGLSTPEPAAAGA